MSSSQVFNFAYNAKFADNGTQIFEVPSNLFSSITNFFSYLGFSYKPNHPGHTLVVANQHCFFVTKNVTKNMPFDAFKKTFSVNALGAYSAKAYDRLVQYMKPSPKQVTVTSEQMKKYLAILNSKKLDDKAKHRKLDPIAIKELPMAKDIVNTFNYLDQLVTSHTPTVAIWFNRHPVLVWYLGFLSTKSYIKIAKKHLDEDYKHNNLNGISTNSQTLRQIHQDNEGRTRNSLIPRRIYSLRPDTVTIDDSTTHNSVDFADLKKAVLNKCREAKQLSLQKKAK